MAMATRQYPYAMDRAAQKWRVLAERRQAHFVELYRTGRYRHYYTDEEFMLRMREAIAAVKRWAEIAPRPDDYREAAE
jgi:uncharacterized repeat protein (TIGR03809 family)